MTFLEQRESWIVQQNKRIKIAKFSDIGYIRKISLMLLEK